jgi:hypothetical protein
MQDQNYDEEKAEPERRAGNKALRGIAPDALRHRNLSVAEELGHCR